MRRIETSILSCQPGLLRQSSRSSLLEVVAAALGRLLVPARPVEAREVGRLPVVRLVGGDAHHLVAVARPVDRAVVLVPGEADRVIGPDPLGERLVVEPRLAAVGDRGQRQRAGQRHAEQRGHAQAGPQRQPLEPQEADGERGDRRAEQQRPRTAERDDGRDDEHEQPDEREERVPAGAAASRPAGELGGQREEQRAADLERGARPRVGAVVRHRHGAERLRAAHDAVDQLAPVARLEVLEVDPGHDERREQARRRRGRQRERVPARRHPLAGDDQRRGGRRRRHPEQGPAGAQPRDHPLPLERAQRGERGESQQPRRPQWQQRVRAALGCAHCADSISF